MLDRLFLGFDRTAVEHGLEKIKTIGDAYMAAAGEPVPCWGHLRAAVAMALELLRIVRSIEGVQLNLRIGIHTGLVVAGVIGESRLQYDLWGETVNIASGLETHGVPGRIYVSNAVRDRLDDVFIFEVRGAIELKGIVPTRTFLVSPRGLPKRIRCP